MTGRHAIDHEGATGMAARRGVPRAAVIMTPPGGLPEVARDAVAEILDNVRPGIVGVVLGGPAAGGHALPWSDLDVYLVIDGSMTDVAGRPAGGRAAGPRRPDEDTGPGPVVNEMTLTVSELARPWDYGTAGWDRRWSFSRAHVLRDDLGGRVTAAVHRQATLLRPELEAILPVALGRYVRLAHRALRSQREGRHTECRLDAAEAVPWFLDTVFTVNGRIRPAGPHLTWELNEYPLPSPAWSTGRLLTTVQGMLDGHPAAIRSGLDAVERDCIGQLVRPA